MALHDVPGSSCMLPTPVLELVIFPRSPGSFYGRMVLETKIWALDVLIAARERRIFILNSDENTDD